MNRRKFLKSSALAIGGLLLPKINPVIEEVSIEPMNVTISEESMQELINALEGLT